MGGLWSAGGCSSGSSPAVTRAARLTQVKGAAYADRPNQRSQQPQAELDDVGGALDERGVAHDIRKQRRHPPTGENGQ
jgi:hypothetical protein